MATNQPIGTITLKNVRLSFPDLFTATEYKNDGKFRFRASFLYAKDSATDKAVQAAIKSVAAEKWPKDFAKKLVGINADPKSRCFGDGDTKEYDGYEGMNYLSSNRDPAHGRPGTYNRDRSPVSEEDGVLYAGCYVNAIVELWAQDNGHGKAIRATLVGVQYVGKGAAFSKATKPAGEMFEDLPPEEDDDDAPIV